MELQTAIDNTKKPASNLDQAVKALRNDFDALRQHVGSLMGSVKTLAEEKAEDGVHKGQEIADEAYSQAKKARNGIEQQIREKPFAAVGIAVGVGAMIALLSRR